MGMGASGGGSSASLPGKDKKIRALVVEDVHIIKKEFEVQVPKFIERIVEVPKYVTKQIQVKDVEVIKETVTAQKVEYEERVVEIPKLVEREVIVEKPVYKEVEVKDVVVKKIEMPIEVPKITEKLIVKETEYEVKVPKLVEELVRVPKIQYVPTEVERIVWKDVPRNRCKHCGKETDLD